MSEGCLSVSVFNVIVCCTMSWKSDLYHNKLFIKFDPGAELPVINIESERVRDGDVSEESITEQFQVFYGQHRSGQWQCYRHGEK